MPEPITLAIAVAGLFIIGFAFAGIKLLESSAQWLGLAFLVFILALLAGRVGPTLLSGEFQQNTGAFLNEALDRVTTAPAQTGWSQLPSRIDPNYLIQTGFLPVLPPGANAQTPPTQPFQPAQPQPAQPQPVQPVPAPLPGAIPPANQPTTPASTGTGRSPVTGLW